MEQSISCIEGALAAAKQLEKDIKAYLDEES